MILLIGLTSITSGRRDDTYDSHTQQFRPVRSGLFEKMHSETMISELPEIDDIIWLRE
jgi:hypothetical protein